MQRLRPPDQKRFTLDARAFAAFSRCHLRCIRRADAGRDDAFRNDHDPRLSARPIAGSLWVGHLPSAVCVQREPGAIMIDFAKQAVRA